MEAFVIVPVILILMHHFSVVTGREDLGVPASRRAFAARSAARALLQELKQPLYPSRKL